MRLLFAISVVSFCTVLWLALSLARRIRRERLGSQRPAVKPLATEFFEAGEFRTPRALRLNQNVTQGRPARHNFGKAASLHNPSGPEDHQTPSLRGRTPPSQPFVANTAAPPEAVAPEAVIINSKLHFVMATPARPAETLLQGTTPPKISNDISSERKSPQSARSGTFRRVDLSHYNEEMGDLTDPYTHSPRASGARDGVAKKA